VQKAYQDEVLESNDETILEWRRKTPYSELVGGLLYLSRNSRSDISYAVAYVARFTSNFSRTDWKNLKGVLAYLKATKEEKLVFRGDESEELIGFSDSDFGGDSQTANQPVDTSS